MSCTPEFFKEFVAVLPNQFRFETLRYDRWNQIYDITLEAPDELEPGLYTCQFQIRPTGFSMDFVPAKPFAGVSADEDAA
jgi:hypothetical protein